MDGIPELGGTPMEPAGGRRKWEFVEVRRLGRNGKQKQLRRRKGEILISAALAR